MESQSLVLFHPEPLSGAAHKGSKEEGQAPSYPSPAQPKEEQSKHSERDLESAHRFPLVAGINAHKA